jgi:hypothetical protein
MSKPPEKGNINNVRRACGLLIRLAGKIVELLDQPDRVDPLATARALHWC